MSDLDQRLILRAKIMKAMKEHLYIAHENDDSTYPDIFGLEEAADAILSLEVERAT